MPGPPALLIRGRYVPVLGYGQHPGQHSWSSDTFGGVTATCTLVLIYLRDGEDHAVGNAMAKRSGGEKVSGPAQVLLIWLPSVGDTCPFGLWPNLRNDVPNTVARHSKSSLLVALEVPVVIRAMV